jgi:hypothetical protein
MTDDTVYLLVDGFDLHEVAPLLRRRFTEFLEARSWVAAEAWFVDSMHETAERPPPGELPQWDMGLNLRFVAAPRARPARWFDDVAATVEFLRALSTETKREFVVGAIFDDEPGEDVFHVGAGPVDLERMRTYFGG